MAVDERGKYAKPGEAKASPQYGGFYSRELKDQPKRQGNRVHEQLKRECLKWMKQQMPQRVEQMRQRLWKKEKRNNGS